MRYRLALDLGTTSLGWAVLRLNEGLRPTAIIRAGVRIFSDGRNPKDGSSLAVQRREARAMRRRRDRLLKRKARMMAMLVKHRFFPEDKAQRKELEKRYPDPYALRAKGLTEALSAGEFARALFHLNQRRGFKSNRRTDKADKESGALKTAISNLRASMQENGLRTVGEYLHRRIRTGETARLRDKAPEAGAANSKKSYEFYIDRQMVSDEFDKLWAVQAGFNPELFNDDARADLRDTLLHQRDLKPVEAGRCTLIPDEKRAPLALPSTQRFRIYQEVNNLRILDEHLNEQVLTLVQRDQIVDELERHNKRSFDQIRRLLKLSGSCRFNLEDAKRTELKGNATNVILSRKEHFGPAWFELDGAHQDEIVEKLCTEESEGALVEWLMAHTGVDEARAQSISETTLPAGFGSLCQPALARIIPALRAEVITYSEAVQKAGFEHHSKLDFPYTPDEVEDWIDPATGEIKPVFKQLPYYGKALQRHVAFGSGKVTDPEEKRYGKIANPTVHIGLNQVRRVVNTLIQRYGRPTEVVVELARDLKESREQRQETQRQQALNQKRNERIRQEIAKARRVNEHDVRGWEIEKWILWEELSTDVASRCCPYSGQQISASKLLSDEVEIEHILPFSRTLDDSKNNKTVSIRAANRIKKNRTPWEARADFEANGWKYEDILNRAKNMPNLQKRQRFAQDAYEKWLGENKDFLARALNDTRHLSRVAKAYLSLVCPGSGVRVIPGRMTAILRRHLGLNDIVKDNNGEKNRCDHRHHAIDACVIGITDQGLLQQFANANKRAKDGGVERLVQDFQPPWPTYWAHVQRAIENIWVSHRPDHGYQGGMMEDTAHGIGKDGRIRQRDGKREIQNVIPISEASQPKRHGVDSAGNPLPYKGYVGGSNYCLEIFKNEKGKWEGEVISTFRAYQIARKEGEARLRDKHFAQNGKPLVMRLMRNDVVCLGGADEGASDRQVLRIVKIGLTGQFFMAPLHEANVDARNRDKDDPFTYVSKRPGSFMASKARLAVVSPIGELKDPGFSD